MGCLCPLVVIQVLGFRLLVWVPRTVSCFESSQHRGSSFAVHEASAASWRFTASPST